MESETYIYRAVLKSGKIIIERIDSADNRRVWAAVNDWYKHLDAGQTISVTKKVLSEHSEPAND